MADLIVVMAMVASCLTHWEEEEEKENNNNLYMQIFIKIHINLALKTQH